MRKTVLDFSGATSSGSRPAYVASELLAELGDPARDLLAGEVDLPDRVTVRGELGG